MTTNTHQPKVDQGIYCAKGGPGRMAERDQFVKQYLTDDGAKIYAEAVAAYQSSGDEKQLAADVHRAVSAGY